MTGPEAPPTRSDLARLVREYLLAGHLIDRAGMPHIIAEHGREVMEAVAIDEWMAASPVYTRRMRRLLRFEGDDVAAIFKGMQLDIGAPPEFMDFRYEVHDRDHGEFRLASCGALMDVEPMGDEYVTSMCHHIEDPTFDATAAAGNPRARVRPIHRPPRQPADRHPHCHWTVHIDPDAEPLGEPEPARLLAGAHAARVPLPAVGPPDKGDDGRPDYRGELDPDLEMESFSLPVLEAVADEVCLQGHLLALGFAEALARRVGTADAERTSLRQFTGIAGLVARRLADRLPGQDTVGGLAAVARVVAHHPAFLPRSYVDLRVGTPRPRVDAGDGEELIVSLGACPALDEPTVAWIPQLAAGHVRPLEAVVQAVEPRARVEPVETDDDAERAWRLVLDPAAPPAEVPDEVVLASFSTGTDFRFRGDPPAPTDAQEGAVT